MKRQPTRERIYVCHTFYHVYVAFLKELNLPVEQRGKATLVLSHMSIQFGDLKSRVIGCGIFEAVVDFDEKKPDFFPELAKYKKPGCRPAKALYNRIRYTKRLAELEAPFIPVDFREYKEIYVFCDSDPIGYYLNQNRIYYHALEDGLNCLWFFDTARYDNRGMFGLKTFLSKKLNLIFIQNGYGKYCLDMEVNDISQIKCPCPYYIQQSRNELVAHLTKEDKELLLSVFVKDIEALKTALNQEGETLLVLTEPVCELPVREQIFRDIINQYGTNRTVIMKPHPRDVIPYRELFPDYLVMDASVPMEMLNFFEKKFSLVVSVLTNTEGIQFAEKIKMLGADFLDAYEEPAIHRQNEQI